MIGHHPGGDQPFPLTVVRGKLGAVVVIEPE